MKKAGLGKIDQRLYFFRLIRKTFKYYFKSLPYIIGLNFIYFMFLSKSFRQAILYYIVTPLSVNPKVVNVILTGIVGTVVLLFKILTYTAAVNNMKARVTYNPMIIFSQVILRFFPAFATFVMLAAMVGFFSLIFALPGLICFVYCHFAVELSAVREVSDGSVKAAKIMMGPTAIARSFNLVRGNFFRVLIFSIIICALFFGLVRPLDIFLRHLLVDYSDKVISSVSFVLYDIFIIFDIVLMMTLEVIEKAAQTAAFGNEGADMKRAIRLGGTKIDIVKMTSRR